MKKTIMYCPLNDGHIIKEIEKFSQDVFETRVSDFQERYGIVKLETTNDFQKLICTLPVIDIQNSDILVFDKVVADYEHKNRLDTFWKTHQMQLQKPDVRKSTPRDLYFVVAAFMQLKTSWNLKHDAKTHQYEISVKDSWNKKDLNIKGYRMKNVKIALRDDKEVSALIELDNDIDIRLSDVTAFGSKNFSLRDEYHLYKTIAATNMQYYHTGFLYAPCVEERCMIENHLESIYWCSKDRFYRVDITASEALTKLKLSEKGVEARAETVARARMVLGCSINHRQRVYSLSIIHGLVVDIRYKKQSIFVAYIPQEKFITL